MSEKEVARFVIDYIGNIADVKEFERRMNDAEQMMLQARTSMHLHIAKHAANAHVQDPNEDTLGDLERSTTAYELSIDRFKECVNAFKESVNNLSRRNDAWALLCERTKYANMLGRPCGFSH